MAFTGQSASGQARQHVGNVINNTAYHYTIRKRRSDDFLRENDRDHAFLRAAAEGQLHRVKHLLQLGVDLDFSDDAGFTALHHAATSGFEDVVDMLLEAGADVNRQSLDLGTPLCLASLRGRENLVSLLLSKYRARVNIAGRWTGTPLHCASWVGSIEVARLLLANAANKTSRNMVQLEFLQYACSIGPMVAIPETPVPRFNNHLYQILECQPIVLAADRGDHKLVQIFIEAGYNINATHRICWTRNPAFETFEEMSPTVMYDRCTVLMGASWTGDTTTISQLIRAGASVNMQDSGGRFPLWLAAQAGNLSCVKLLVQEGAELGATDVFSRSPLDIAIEEERVSIVDYLNELKETMEHSQDVASETVTSPIGQNSLRELNTTRGELAYSTMRPGKGQRCSVRDIERQVRDILRSPVMHYHKRRSTTTGFIYALRDPELDLVKIGFTVRDIDVRTNRIKTICRPSEAGLELIAHERIPGFVQRAEQVIHQDLAPHEMIFDCACGLSRSRKGELTTHREWYNITADIAAATLEMWARFFRKNPYNPYTTASPDVSTLKSVWCKRLEKQWSASEIETHQDHGERLRRWAALLEVDL